MHYVAQIITVIIIIIGEMPTLLWTAHSGAKFNENIYY